MLTATIRDARAQAAPRPHHRVDRTRRGLPGRDVRPHRHHGARVLAALRQGVGTDAVVRTEAPYSATEGIGTSRGPIAASVLPQVAKVDGVRTAEGSVTGYAADRQRRPRHPHQGARRRATAWPPTSGFAVTSPAVRHGPTTGHEVAIDATSAEEHDIALGSTIKVLFQGPTQEFTVVGTVASAARRTSAAPRRRTSTRRPRSGSSAAPASSTRSG